MKEELYKKLLVWINNIESFASEQIPDFAQQVIVWGIWSNLIYSLLFFFAFVLFIFIFRFCLKKHNEYTKTDRYYYGGAAVCAGIVAFMSIIWFFCAAEYATYAIKATVAPKLYLVDYFMGRDKK